MSNPCNLPLNQALKLGANLADGLAGQIDGVAVHPYDSGPLQVVARVRAYRLELRAYQLAIDSGHPDQQTEDHDDLPSPHGVSFSGLLARRRPQMPPAARGRLPLRGVYARAFSRGKRLATSWRSDAFTIDRDDPPEQSVKR